MTVRVLHGDCRTVLATLPSASVHCCVTSPPYFNLRAYLPDGHPNKPMEIGLEQTPDAYVAKLVAVFREVRRVLRKDGTLWLNLGDSYAGSAQTGGNNSINASGGVDGYKQQRQFKALAIEHGLKPKDVLGVPWRAAFALQADGWYLRQDLIWSKPNPMPESARDRCTKAHEYVFLLSKSARYYYDSDAISEPAVGDAFRPTFRGGAYVGNSTFDNSGAGGRSTDTGNVRIPNQMRNRRSVWTIATEPSSLGHFALMPSALAELCIKAGTSERGCCPTCAAPWVRQVEIMRSWRENAKPKEQAYGPGSGNRTARSQIGGMSRNEYAHRGCSPSCRCPAHTPQPCTVLDPFGGGGTTGLVADRLGRDAVLIELSPAYAATARRRIEDDAGMFASVVQAAQ